MTKVTIFAISLLVLNISGFAQNDVFTFRGGTTGTFVWGQDSVGGALSSIIQDPLTAKPILKLSYAGVEVSSRLGFEGIGRGEAGDFLAYTSVIVNNTTSILSVRYGGMSVEGHTGVPISVEASENDMKTRKSDKRVGVVRLENLHCFTGDYLSRENFISAHSSSESFNVNPGNALTISSVTKDPRYYSVRCSIAGCYPTGTIRYSLIINSHEYVFVWPGQSVVYCGK